MSVYTAKNPHQGKSEKEFVSALAEYVKKHNGYVDTNDYISFSGQVQIVVGIDSDDFERVMLMWMPVSSIVCVKLYEEQYDSGYKQRAFEFIDGFFEGGISRDGVPFEEIVNSLPRFL